LGPFQARRQPRSRQGARRPRRRRCLIKGCEKLFYPTHPQARYCSPECRATARRWRRRRASRQYRRTAKGQEKRRDQSQRYRCRCAKRRREAEAKSANSAVAGSPCEGTPQGCEGQRAAEESRFFCCDRPGCKEHVVRSKRSPCQRFCSPSCRQALRRVIERERRWWQRVGKARRHRPAGRCRGP
jgi:hypothetical protein